MKKLIETKPVFIAASKGMIPTTEVICRNWNGEYMVGFLEYEKDHKEFICTTEDDILMNVTHWASIKSIEDNFKE